MIEYSRTMGKSKYILLVIFLLTVFGATAQQAYELNTHLKITGFQTAQPPELHGRRVIMSYKGEERIRAVGIAFEHERFSRVHPFYRNEFDVFVIVYDLPREEDQILYRLVVDGLWMDDPANPDRVQTPSGIILSRVRYDIPKDDYLVSPIPRDNDRYEFHIRAPAGRRISISGTFNEWDPFTHELTYIGNNRYSISLRLPPGRHYYYFIVNGERQYDTLNPEQAADIDGSIISSLWTGPPLPIEDEEGGLLRLLPIGQD